MCPHFRESRLHLALKEPVAAAAATNPAALAWTVSPDRPDSFSTAQQPNSILSLRV
jgi:hypothetical protein